ncbi:MAG: peptide MFS transporter [Saprospiraceae bacterium]|nr:peptide MFS transporter [Saprospiraceae bacterium]
MSKQFFGHPIGLSTLFFTEMWERFSYYGMRALLILFMVAATESGGLGFSSEEAAAIYGLYTCGVYLLTLPGGWLADRVIGAQKAIWYGGIIIMLGHFTLAIPSETTFFLGLGLIVIGTGLLKPNVSAIVGDLYPEGGARRDAGFSVFYMGINIGAFLGPLVCSYLGEEVNWHAGFAFAGVGMFFGLVQFHFMKKNLGEVGLQPNINMDKNAKFGSGNNQLAAVFGIGAVLLLVALQSMGIIDLYTPRGLAEATFVIIGVVAVGYFAYVLLAGGLDGDEKRKVVVIFVLVMAAAMFWAGFEQAGSSLNLFGERYTNRMVDGWEIPAGWLQSVNPMFIIIFSPIFGALWVKLAMLQLNPRTPIKFALGLILLALGFFVMVQAAGIAASGLPASPFFLILTYFLHTSGELCLSPVGLSTTTKLAPRRYVSQMMGMWFVGTALGNLVAGLVAGAFDPENVQQMPDLFMSVVLSTGGAGLVILALSPWMQRWMGEIK